MILQTVAGSLYSYSFQAKPKPRMAIFVSIVGIAGTSIVVATFFSEFTHTDEIKEVHSLTSTQHYGRLNVRDC